MRRELMDSAVVRQCVLPVRFAVQKHVAAFGATVSLRARAFQVTHARRRLDYARERAVHIDMLEGNRTAFACSHVLALARRQPRYHPIDGGKAVLTS